MAVNYNYEFVRGVPFYKEAISNMFSRFIKCDPASTEESLLLTRERHKNILKELKEYNKYKTEDVDLEPLITKVYNLP